MEPENLADVVLLFVAIGLGFAFRATRKRSLPLSGRVQPANSNIAQMHRTAIFNVLSRG